MFMWLRRVVIYLLGMTAVSTGIVLCALCGLGISPVSSWPYIMKDIVPLSFGTLTMIFHFINIAIQYILERKLMNVRVFLQIPVALLFGVFIDALKGMITVDTSSFIMQSLALVFSILFTALGMILMINMDLIQNPPDGCVKDLSEITGIQMGNMKLIYDCSMVITSSAASYLLSGNLYGLGIATIASAVFVGKTLTFFDKRIGNILRKFVSLE